MNQETYDILNVGEQNRFFIRNSEGEPLCVHNCGYGAGAAKFADLMVQSGLADQADQAERLIATYRSANYMVKNFWGICQQALETMAQGGTMRFGGPDDNLFEASGATKFHGVTIPSIKLPNGTYIFYQNLRQEVDDEGKLNYVYDQWKGRGFEPKRIWGSALAENLCIAEDTLVLTDSGWKKIQDITTFDKVHDGIDFVTHGGLVFKSVKDCVEVDGVYMTKDHEVLTKDGWKTAEIHLSAGATSQLSRFDFSEVWQADRYPSNTFRWKEMVLGLPMRLWECSKSFGIQSKKAVYDILNCGERNRFVVKGETAPFVVHNCQALSFAILKWQAMCIQADGYQINLNIHDEWAGVYSKDNLKGAVLSFHRHMSRVPPFLPKADGLLACEVDVGTNYAEFTTIPNSAFEETRND